jgi:hypothetical protein
MALNAICVAPGSARKKGGDTDERAPQCSESGREWKSTDRWALLRSEMGEGGECVRADRGRAGHATRPRARCVRGSVRGRGVGPPTAQGQGPSAGGESWARVCARPDLGLGVDTKEKTLKFLGL